MSAVAVRLPERTGAMPRRLGQAGLGVCLATLVSVLPPLLARTAAVPLALAAVAALLGVAAWRGDARRLGLGVVVLAALSAVGGLLLQQATIGTLRDVVSAGLFAATLRFATPLALAALGACFAERSGVVNIALEGTMLIGAFTGVFVAERTGSWVAGVLAAVGCGMLIALIQGALMIHLRADQIVTGTGINIFAAGVTAYLLRTLYGPEGVPPAPRIPNVSLPVLRDLPLLGGVIGDQNLIVWLTLLLAAVASWMLFRTPWGLRLRAVGEHPRAADTVGVNVFRLRYQGMLISGALAALAGAFLSFGLLGTFTENMTAGRGFIALAVLILGKWHPGGIVAAALMLGFSSALGDQLQTVSGASASLMAILPYAVTLVVLVGVVGRSVPPAAVGRPYAKQ
jgi:general nucleoside transport system permease protein